MPYMVGNMTHVVPLDEVAVILACNQIFPLIGPVKCLLIHLTTVHDGKGVAALITPVDSPLIDIDSDPPHLLLHTSPSRYRTQEKCSWSG